MKIGNREFDVKNKTYIMGILNVTPDSFSDGGKWNDMDHALKHTEAMIAEGADILDIGGESTRPGHTPVGAQEEIERILPVIEAVKGRFDIPISVDTYKGCVAEEALKHGADLINDIWGLKYDPEMAPVIARYQAPCCLMHNREKIDYRDFLPDCMADIRKIIETAKVAGIAEDKMILDPGVGFGKTLEQNLMVMKHLNDFNQFGYPVLLGTSRKSMIGLTLDLPVTEREEGTLVTTVMAVQSHYGFVRVHDAEKNRRAIKMTEVILARE